MSYNLTRRAILGGSALLLCAGQISEPAAAQTKPGAQKLEAFLNAMVAFNKAGGTGKGVANRPGALNALEQMQKLAPAAEAEIAAFCKNLAETGKEREFDAGVLDFMRARKAPQRLIDMGEHADGAVAVLRKTNSIIKADINNRRNALGLHHMSAKDLLEDLLAALNPIGRAEALENPCSIVHYWMWVTVRVMETATKTGNTVSSDHILESANKNCN